MTTNDQIKQNRWIDRLYQIENHLTEQNADQSLLHKIQQLTLKADTHELTVAFCGHFSAGKSSMINKLMGDDLLPSSPIPTSANIVAIREGEPQVILTDQQGKKVSYGGEINLEEVKKASKDGDAIKTIEIFKHHPFLQDNTVLMDTPGIDSTDDAHRISTESMLHLADVIIYVMDYNHVQSELNFNFTKEMQDAGKEVYLVINQIDKHNDDELSFSDYKEQTVAAFLQWGVRPKDTFFTSLKSPDHPENDLEKLQDELRMIKANKDGFIDQTLESMTSQIIKDYLEKKYPDVHSESNVSDNSEEELKSLEDQILTLDEQEGVIEKEFQTELKKLISNARVVPYEVREQGRSVLESLKEDFKTGLFFTKKKTEEERQARIDLFVGSVNERVKTELAWHLKDELKQQLKKLNVHDAELENEILEMEHSFDRDDVLQLQQKGATFNETYVLQYNGDVEDELKKRYRKSAVQLFEKIKEKFIDEQVSPERNLLHERREALKAEFNKKQEAQAIQEQHLEEEQTLQRLMRSDEQVGGIREWINEIEKANQIDAIEGAWEAKESTDIGDESSSGNQEEYLVEDQSSNGNIERAATQLDEASVLLSDWASLRDLTKRMKERSDKIKNNQYTVALFGAFSAGKSSFANAWLKDNVLPVSPNPTTATINKILPVTDEYKHGTVKIQFKPSDVILEEVNHSLQRFGEQSSTLEMAVEQINVLETEKPDPHVNFLRAVAKGYPVMKEYLGSEQIIDHESFASFVAQEERACFTESVELYYDCELTRQGITLVDTPGADSINARHTSVAFEYIKNADAIVFVTYYNHAFSKADRDFLIQLGRVKDTFSMDKMYFVINAADLASDDEERGAVVDYVTSELNAYGIRHPRMYALSSKEALKERKGLIQGDDSKFSAFAESFETTTIRERDEILHQQADQLLQAGLDRLLDWIHNAQSNKDQQEVKKENFKQDRDEITERIKGSATSPYENAVVQETKELLYYVVQRLMLTFNDEFKVAFNPSVLSEENAGKEQLQRCLDELLESMAFQLAQELRATTLRVEKNVNAQRRQFYKMASGITAGKNSYEFMEMEDVQLETPEVDPKWSESVLSDMKPQLKRFKNPKQFFEGNGRELLREELAQAFQPELQTTVQHFTDTFTQFYQETLKGELNHLKEQFTAEIVQYYQGLLDSFGSKEQLEALQSTKTKLERIMNQGERIKYE